MNGTHSKQVLEGRPILSIVGQLDLKRLCSAQRFVHILHKMHLGIFTLKEAAVATYDLLAGITCQLLKGRVTADNQGTRPGHLNSDESKRQLGGCSSQHVQPCVVLRCDDFIRRIALVEELFHHLQTAAALYE